MDAKKINLLSEEYINEAVQFTDCKHKLTVNGLTKSYNVYKINLDLLYYNDKNGRIASWISQYESENGKINMSDRSKYNDIIQNMIWDSNPEAMTNTKNNIFLRSQQVPGVVLTDGRIIDGNRRYTCLRELTKENKEGFRYFEAVILEGDYAPTDKVIKTLELSLQLGTEKPVDYGPIEAMIDVYENVDKNGLFDVSEYAKAANMKDSEVRKLLTKARLMVEFLEFIDAPEQFYIAREMKLDGPLEEAIGALKKCKNRDDREDMKNTIFTAFIYQPEGDPTRYIRKFKTIANSKESEAFLQKQNVYSQRILDKMGASKKDSPLERIKEVRSDDSLKEDMTYVTNRAVNKVEKSVARNLPLSKSREVVDLLEDIPMDLVDNLDEEGKKQLREYLDTIQEKLEDLRGHIN